MSLRILAGLVDCIPLRPCRGDHAGPMLRWRFVFQCIPSGRVVRQRLSRSLSQCFRYYWRFTHISLSTGFGQDDLMNLDFAWRNRSKTY